MRVKVWVAAAGLLLAGCASGGGKPSGARTGEVDGVVLSAPTCPVERVGVPCPPRPVAGAAVVALARARTASTRTNAAGRFTLMLQPGSYLIRATNVGGYASTAERTVIVRPNSVTKVRLVVDSGIR